MPGTPFARDAAGKGRCVLGRAHPSLSPWHGRSRWVSAGGSGGQRLGTLRGALRTWRLKEKEAAAGWAEKCVFLCPGFLLGEEQTQAPAAPPLATGPLPCPPHLVTFSWEPRKVWNPQGRLSFASLPAPRWVKPFFPTPKQGVAGPGAEVRLGALHSRFGWWQGAGPGPGTRG